MPNTRLDFTAVWNDTTSLLNQHKEAAAAIAGVFIFLPAWLIAYFIGPPNLDNISDPTQILVIMQDYYASNFLALMSSSLVTVFGSVAYYIILVRENIATVGGALKASLGIFLIYLVANIITGAATGFGFMLFAIPGMYLMGRFSTLAGVLAAEPQRGIIGSISRAWALTNNVGWMAFLIIIIVAIIGGIIVFIVGQIFTLLLGFIGGTTATLLTTGVGALLNAGLSIVMGTLGIAIYRHLKPQVHNAAAVNMDA